MFLKCKANRVLFKKYMYGFLPRVITFSNVPYCKHGYNIKSFILFFRTAIHLACAQGKEDIVKFLLANNAKTNLCDNDGRTPLMKVSANHILILKSKNGREIL